MQISSRKWFIISLMLTIFLELFFILCVWIVDPFEHYRESDILPLYDQESYNNPGIVQNYQYDAAILGTSMIEMSKPSTIDRSFVVHSVKLPMRGSYTAQMGWQMKHIFTKDSVRLIILEVDPYALLGRPDDKEEIVEYLWNGIGADDVYYLLNRDVVALKIPKMLQNRGKSLEYKRDSMYQWEDVVFSEKNALRGLIFEEFSEMQYPDSRNERIANNIRIHLIPEIERHPETEFLIYYPPYSIAYWYARTSEGISEVQLNTKIVMYDLMKDYSNVKMYDYSAELNWIENFDNYFDFSHHSTQISDAIMERMSRNEGKIESIYQIQENNEQIRRAVKRFIERYNQP